MYKCCIAVAIGLTVMCISALWIGFAIQKKVDVNTAKLVFIYIDNTTDIVEEEYFLNETRQLLKNPYFDTEKPTVLLIHDYDDSLKGNFCQLLTDAYLKRNDHNILALDWEELSQGSLFFNVIHNQKLLGNLLGDNLFDILSVGFSLRRLHVVGFSAGAPLAALVGRKIIKRSSDEIKIQRITGLDPLFWPYSMPFFFQLDKSDATFVDVIHTNHFTYSSPGSIGTVDFWPNGGKSVQPGCPANRTMVEEGELCSHERAYVYYAESVTNIESFHAIKCGSWRGFQINNGCNTSDIICMGIGVDLSATGDYYLQTNDTSPYSKEMSGAYFTTKGLKKVVY